MSSNTGKVIMFGWKRWGPNTIWKKVSLQNLNVREYQSAIQKWQSRGTQDEIKQTKHNSIYVRYHYAHTHTHTHTHTHLT